MSHIGNIKKLFSKNFVESPLIETFEAGKLQVTSGHIVVCDPVITPDKSAFRQVFPKGNFSIFVHKERDSNCIAYSEVVFGDDEISNWEMALCDDQNLNDLVEGEIFGFPVESGMAAVMDFETQTEIGNLEQELYQKKGVDFKGIFEEFFQPYFYDADGAIDQFAIMKPYEDKPQNMLTNEAGYGEGFYASYIGYSKDNIPQKLVTEFIEIQ